MSLVDESPVENTPNGTSQDREPSFLERKQAALNAESASVETPDTFDTESAEDAGYAESPEGEYDDQVDSADGEDTPEESDLVDDEHADDEDSNPEGEHDWQERHKQAQAELTRLQTERKTEREENSKAVEENIGLRHTLEDQLAVAQRQGQFLHNLLNQNVLQYENMDWTQVPVEKTAELRQQHQLAVNSRNQMQAALEQMEAQGKQAVEHAKQREAEVSKQVLKRTIPNWGKEVYGEIQDFAVEQGGYTAQEVAAITDHRWVRMMYANMQNAKSMEQVKEVKRQGKKRGPKNRNAKQPARNAQGRFQSAREDSRANPGDRGKIRNAFEQKLAAERERGVRR